MNILVPDVSIVEKPLRSVVVYTFLLVAFRRCGKRQLGQITAFDLAVLLIISNVVQNAVIGDDNSRAGSCARTCGASSWAPGTFEPPRAE